GTQFFTIQKPQQTFADCKSDFRGGKLAVRLQERRASLVALADDARAFRNIIEDVADLLLDDRRLFFDDDDFFQARGETLQDFRVERPGERQFQQADVVVHAELGKRLARVVI